MKLANSSGGAWESSDGKREGVGSMPKAVTASHSAPVATALPWYAVKTDSSLEFHACHQIAGWRELNA
jgi:hypothetical protein